MCIPRPSPRDGQPAALVCSTDAGLERRVAWALSPAFVIAVARADGHSTAPDVDLVVLDEEWLRDTPEARRRLDGVPVIAVLRRDDPARAVALLESGVDDVVRDPFDAAEVRARAQSLVRRSRRAATPSTHVYDRLRREVRRADGTRRRLTASESIVLESLLDAGGDVVHRESLLARLVDQPLQVESNVVERHVATLRAKLGDDRRSQRFIATVPRRGYRFAQAALTQA